MAVEKVKYRLKGHETFMIREGWLNKALQEVEQNPLVFSVHQGADVLGVGTNMAKAIRYWMKVSNLVKEVPREGAFLTEQGRVIFENDPYFEDHFSLWIVHIGIVKDIEKATSWSLFFNRLELTEFTKEELFVELKKELLLYAQVEEISDRSLSDDCNGIIHMYTRTKIENYDPEDKRISPFSVFGLLKKNGNRYQKTFPNRNILNEMVLAYLLVEILEQETAISMDDLLLKDNMPGKILNMNRLVLNESLDKLENRGYIRVNRTAGLDMVYKLQNVSEVEVLKAYYATVKRLH